MRYMIHNLRAGFATNSSSAHSVVLLPQSWVGKVPDQDVPARGDYGNQDFCLSSTTEKMRYLAAQLFSEGMEDADREDLIQKFEPYVSNIRPLIERANEESYSCMYVDHQSRFDSLPAKYSPALATRLMKVFLDDRILIRGGYDGGPHDYGVPGHITSSVPLVELLKGSYRNKTRTDGEYVVIFNTESGTKVRISEEDAPPYVKASAPELVDLKITDYCGAGCNFCYQSSTTAGKHAPLADIKAMSHALQKMDVFEVAIGGGEPTDHPEFPEILADIARRKMVVNFTTFSNRWLADKAKVEAVQKHVRAIGVSVTNAKGLELIEQIRDGLMHRHPKHGSWPWEGKLMAQHVVGSVPLHVTAEFMREAFKQRVPVLLLGYKEVGFGQSYTRHDRGEDVPFFLRMAVNTKEAELSVDTALVDQYPDFPKLLGAPEALTTSPEGKFSCYIDAVTGRMAASSYVPPETMDPLPMLENGTVSTDAFLKTFARY